MIHKTKPGENPLSDSLFLPDPPTHAPSPPPPLTQIQRSPLNANRQTRKMFEFHRLTRPGNVGTVMSYVRLSFEIAIIDRWHCQPVMYISNSNRTGNRYVFIGCEEIFKRCSVDGWRQERFLKSVSSPLCCLLLCPFLRFCLLPHSFAARGSDL